MRFGVILCQRNIGKGELANLSKMASLLGILSKNSIILQNMKCFAIFTFNLYA